MNKKKLLLIGYGDIAKRCVKQLLAHGQRRQWEIVGVSRSVCHQTTEGFSHIKGDICSKKVLERVASESFDAIVITLTPSEYSDAGYRKAYVEPLEQLKRAWGEYSTAPKFIIFVSSTSVYGQEDGQWIDEGSDTLPKFYRGKRLLEAENIVSNLQSASGKKIPSTSLRFSGIYGPTRHHLLHSVTDGILNGGYYTNRIHAVDCASIITHLLTCYFTHQTFASVLLASDCLPEKSYVVRTWLANELTKRGVELAPSEGESSTRKMASKRCSNTKLLEMGYAFKYREYQQGFQDVLDEFAAKRI